MSIRKPVDDNTKKQLDAYLEIIESALDADVLTIVSPILYGLDVFVRQVIELNENKRPKLAVIIDTQGGIAEVVERMVKCIRHFYSEVYFLIPDRAMSAGTIFALSGDKIYMSYFSVLGPIDPQIEKDGKLVPALSYLEQYKTMCEKADKGILNTAEFALLSKLDLGELHQFEQARELSVELLENWLSKYKFKDWTKEEVQVSEETKRERAKQIGGALSNNKRWHSHGRGIDRDTLTEEMRIKVDKVEDTPGLATALDDYFALLRDYMGRIQYQTFVHTRKVF